MPSLATWFTPSLQTISRSSGRSAVAASAYRACTLLHDERTGITHDFTPKAKRGLAKNICVGIKYNDIAKFWNNAERAENRANSTVARELMLPLPDEWTDSQNEKCVLEIAQMLNDKYHVGVQADIHRPSMGSKNKHVHMMFSTREIDEYNYPNGGFGKKTRILDDLKTGEVKRLREAVAEIVNSHARANGNDWFVTAGKYAEHIKDHVSTHHISVNHGKKQKEYIDLNRAEVKEARNEISKLQRQIDDIDEKVAKLTEVKEIQVEDDDSQIIAANEHRIKEVAENYADWLKASNDLMNSMERTRFNIGDYEAKKKGIVALAGLEEWEISMTAFKDDLNEEANKLNRIQAKLNDTVNRALYSEYQRRESVNADTKTKLKGVIDLFGDPPITDEDIKAVKPRLTDRQLIDIAYNAPEPANEWVFESDEEKIERVAAHIAKAIKDDGPVMINAPSTINGPHVNRETTSERAKRLAAEALGLSHVIK